jgi:hypothetical protein
MTKKIIIFTVLAITLAACGGANSANNTASTNSANTNAANKTTAQTTPTIDPNTVATFPFKDFPAVETTAKTGEVVLVPSYNWLQEATVNGADKVTMIWYSQTMGTPDKEMSEVKFMSDTKKVPNAYIVAIPPGGTAKKGDILLTWWQSGSGMQRAIVTDDSTPTEPVVRYLDLDYDNPAKAKDGKTNIGQMEEKLKPNTFVKINAPFDVGTMVAVQDGAEQKPAQVIRVAGDKVFVNGFAGRIAVVDKSRCTPFPLKSDAKVGDKVKAVWVNSLKEGTVTKIDPAIGRVFIKFDLDGKEKAVSFGEVMK